MTVTLSPEQLAWIEARVASGDFPDVDGAVRVLLADAIAEHQGNDMAWARPLVDEALREVERGEAMTVAEFEARIDARMAALSD